MYSNRNANGKNIETPNAKRYKNIHQYGRLMILRKRNTL